MSQTLLVVLLALALVFVGFGHRMAGPDAPGLSAYAMPDGTLPDLCVDGSGGNSATDTPCPACTITAAMHLPAAVALPAVQLSRSQADWPLPAPPDAQAHQPRAPPARGPPTAFLIV